MQDIVGRLMTHTLLCGILFKGLEHLWILVSEESSNSSAPWVPWDAVQF